VIADTDGGANGATRVADGGFLVANNGGVDLARTGVIENPPPPRIAPPGLQRVSPDGEVTYLARDGLDAPNDVCAGADGVVYFTDPGHFPPPEGKFVGRVMAYEPDGALRTHADGFWFCNGIAFEPSGTLVVVEQAGLQRLNVDGSREWVIERLGRGAGDGFCLDRDGRFYVASTVAHGVRVIEDGKEVDFLEIPGEGVTSNCCFGGADGRLLFATDAVPGRVVVWEGLTTPGLPIHAWPGPA
jgi:sugar lactone lactonase YvrE